MQRLHSRTGLHVQASFVTYSTTHSAVGKWVCIHTKRPQRLFPWLYAPTNLTLVCFCSPARFTAAILRKMTAARGWRSSICHGLCGMLDGWLGVVLLTLPLFKTFHAALRFLPCCFPVISLDQSVESNDIYIQGCPLLLV